MIDACFGDRRPAGQTVADRAAPGLDLGLGETLHLLLAKTLDGLQLDPPRTAFDGGLDRGDEWCFARNTAAALAAGALNAGLPQRSAAEIGIVHLDPPFELRLGLFPRLHRYHHLVFDQPGGRFADTQSSPEFRRGDPALALADMVDRQKPDLERQFGAVEDRARGHRSLMFAAVALQLAALLQIAMAAMTAGRTGPTLAPAPREQRRPTLLLAAIGFLKRDLAKTLGSPIELINIAHP